MPEPAPVTSAPLPEKTASRAVLAMVPSFPALDRRVPPPLSVVTATVPDYVTMVLCRSGRPAGGGGALPPGFTARRLVGPAVAVTPRSGQVHQGAGHLELHDLRLHEAHALEEAANRVDDVERADPAPGDLRQHGREEV